MRFQCFKKRLSRPWGGLFKNLLINYGYELPEKLSEAGCLAKDKERKARRIIEQMI